MTITTTTDLPAPVQLSFSFKLLAVPVPDFINNIPAMRKTMPANGGTTIRYRRYNPLKSSIVPLGNSGVTPPAQEMSAVNIDAQMSFYGQYVALEEQVTLQNQDPVLNETVKRLGVSLRQTEDELTRNMLLSTASSINATAGTNGDNPTEIKRDDIDGVIRALRNNNAYRISDMIEGEDRFGTAPVRDAYFALGSTELIGTLDRIDGWISKVQYPSQMTTLKPEEGSVSNIRFLLSSVGSVSENASALGANVYNTFVCGMEAYAVVEQDRYSASFIYRPPIYSGPLAQFATVGWKMAQVPKITNDAWVLNLRSTLA
jgi:N4-gp56 family major capsid protein